MRKASILLAMAALLGTACATATGHLPGGTGPGISSAGSVTLVRLQPRVAVQAQAQAQPQPQPSLAPPVRVTLTPGRPAPESRPPQPSDSAAPGSNPVGRCVGSPNPGPHQPEPMCALP